MEILRKKFCEENETSADFDEVVIKEEDNFYLIQLISIIEIDLDNTDRVEQLHSCVDKTNGNILFNKDSSQPKGNVFISKEDILLKVLNVSGRLKVSTYSLIELIYSYKVDISCCDAFGENCLIQASSYGSLSCVEYILSNKLTIDINKQNDSGCTALMKAICKKSEVHLKIISLLLNYNAKTNIMNNWGRQALHIGCFIGNIKGVKLLLEYTSNISSVDITNKTPLHYATDKYCFVSQTGVSSFNSELYQLLS